MKSSWRWGPPIGGCESPWKVLRTGMTNQAVFFARKTLCIHLSNHKFLLANFVNISVAKTAIFKGFFQMFILGSTVHFGEHCSYWGANGIVKSLLFMNSAPQNEQRSQKWTVLSKMNSAPQNERCSPKWKVLPKMNRSLFTIPLAPQNKQCSSKRTVLPKMNIWRNKLKKMAVFATKTWAKVAKKNCD